MAIVIPNKIDRKVLNLSIKPEKNCKLSFLVKFDRFQFFIKLDPPTKSYGYSLDLKINKEILFAITKTLNQLINQKLYTPLFIQLDIFKNPLVKEMIFPEKEPGKMIKNALKCGDLEQIEAIFKPGLFISEKDRGEALLEAAKRGDLKIIKQLLPNGFIISDEYEGPAICLAAKNGHFKAVEFFLFKRPFFSEHTRPWAVIDAASNGHLEIVKLLLSNGSFISEDDQKEAIAQAVSNGHVKVIEFFLPPGAIVPKNALLNAVGHGQVEVVKFFIIRNFIISSYQEEALLLASKNGHLEIIELFLETSFFTQDLLEKVLKQAITHGYNPTLISIQESLNFTKKESLHELLASFVPKGLLRTIKQYRHIEIREHLLKSLHNIYNKGKVIPLGDIESNSQIAHGLSATLLSAILPTLTISAGAGSSLVAHKKIDQIDDLLKAVIKYKAGFKEADRLKALLYFLIKIKTLPISIDKKCALIKQFLNPEFSLNEIINLMMLLPLSVQQLGVDNLLEIPFFNQEILQENLSQILIGQGFLRKNLKEKFKKEFLFSRRPSAIFSYASLFISDSVMKKEIRHFISLICNQSLQDWRMIANSHLEFLSKHHKWGLSTDPIEFTVAKFQNLEFSAQDFIRLKILPLANKEGIDLYDLIFSFILNKPLPITSSALLKKIEVFFTSSFEKRGEALEGIIFELKDKHPESALIPAFEDLKKTKKSMVIDSEDWQDLFLSGTEVGGSCQHVLESPHENKCLLANVLDGKIRILCVKDEPNGSIKARAFLKILTKKIRLPSGQKKQVPCLFLEPIYPEKVNPIFQKQIVNLARKKAAELELDLYVEGMGEKLYSKSSIAPFEYEDALFPSEYRIIEKGEIVQINGIKI